MTPFEDVRLASAGFKADPYPVYARLRAEVPICRVTLPSRETVYLVTRYDDVSALLKDPRFAKDSANALTTVQLAQRRKPPKIFAPLTRNMLDRDDPDHARLKRLVQAAFTPKRIEMLTDRTRAISTRLLDRVHRDGSFDLIRDYAMPLPVTVISDLIGVPEQDRAKFARWSAILIRNTMTPLAILRSLPSLLGFVRYLRTLIEQRRREPQDDLVSALLAQEAGERLDADELLGMLAILLTAGHETTTNLIGNGMLALLQEPNAFEQLQASPALVDSAVEEVLRFASPVATTTHRYAREDMEFAGAPIPRGTVVLGAIASANRDERRFDNADALELGRAPNRHLTFGEGGHYCVGAALARMEGRIAFVDLVQRFPALSLGQSAAALRWRPGLVLRGLESLPVLASGRETRRRSRPAHARARSWRFANRWL